MKNIKSLILIGCLSLTSLTSCFFEEEDIFEKSAAQRMNIALAEYFDLLTSSPNGWVLNYFPTDDQIGYTLLMNFDKNSSVRIAAKNQFTSNQYKDSVSLFQMVGSNGPVLTFDTKNPILHVFSNPEDPDGLGMEGDYEFIVMRTSPDKIILKGAKRGVYMDLTRLPEDQNWVDYFKKLDEISNLMFNRSVSRILLTVNGFVYTLDNGFSHTFLKVPEGGDAITENERIPFIVTDKGIQFSKIWEVNGAKIRDFHLSEDKNELLCVDKGENAKITSLFPADFFFSFINNRRGMAFINSDASMSTSIKSAFTAVNNGVIAQSRRLDYIQFVNDRNWGPSLAIRTSRTGGNNIEGFLNFTMTKINDSEINFAFNGFTGSFDRNGQIYYNTYNGVSEFVELIKGSYKFEIQGYALTSIKMRLTSTTDPNKWFDLIAN
ncbi:MAG: DUF4302 domain-containing protein [Dysgonamonadaceae bacterium]|jgi:hypothetical protein|nr:DUF4302 domain-containing protein [Dysgonamonadaceae bacterium]